MNNRRQPDQLKRRYEENNALVNNENTSCKRCGKSYTCIEKYESIPQKSEVVSVGDYSINGSSSTNVRNLSQSFVALHNVTKEEKVVKVNFL